MAHEIKHEAVKMLVAPPPARLTSLNHSSFPHFLFDVIFFCTSSYKGIFFYEFPGSSHSSLPPILKHSLFPHSLTSATLMATLISPSPLRSWHPLVPTLSSPRLDRRRWHTCVHPLMPIQLTILPNSGFGICSDGKSLHQVLVCKARGDMASLARGLSSFAFKNLKFLSPNAQGSCEMFSVTMFASLLY
ncbi:hypothetical protein E2542_SST26239 [Spatholobus suberectus]|nr:hypothetical protein E2542_SST26239 [Spatholobus suberectus]